MGADTGDVWRRSSFNGREFTSERNPGVPSLYQRPGFLPVISTAEGCSREDRLPSGMGGLAVLCYIQTEGGKMASSKGYLPCASAAIEIRGGEQRMVVRADDGGYVVLSLPEGEYTVVCQAVSRKVRIERLKTAVIALRAGKRMVD